MVLQRVDSYNTYNNERVSRLLDYRHRPSTPNATNFRWPLCTLCVAVQFLAGPRVDRHCMICKLGDMQGRVSFGSSPLGLSIASTDAASHVASLSYNKQICPSTPKNRGACTQRHRRRRRHSDVMLTASRLQFPPHPPDPPPSSPAVGPVNWNETRSGQHTNRRTRVRAVAESLPLYPFPGAHWPCRVICRRPAPGQVHSVDAGPGARADAIGRHWALVLRPPRADRPSVEPVCYARWPSIGRQLH